MKIILAAKQRLEYTEKKVYKKKGADARSDILRVNNT